MKTGSYKGFRLTCDRDAVKGSFYCLEHQHPSVLKGIIRDQEAE